MSKAYRKSFAKKNKRSSSETQSQEKPTKTRQALDDISSSEEETPDDWSSRINSSDSDDSNDNGGEGNICSVCLYSTRDELIVLSCTHTACQSCFSKLQGTTVQQDSKTKKRTSVSSADTLSDSENADSDAEHSNKDVSSALAIACPTCKKKKPVPSNMVDVYKSTGSDSRNPEEQTSPQLDDAESDYLHFYWDRKSADSDPKTSPHGGEETLEAAAAESIFSDEDETRDEQAAEHENGIEKSEDGTAGEQEEDTEKAVDENTTDENSHEDDSIENQVDESLKTLEEKEPQKKATDENVHEDDSTKIKVMETLLEKLKEQEELLDQQFALMEKEVNARYASALGVLASARNECLSSLRIVGQEARDKLQKDMESLRDAHSVKLRDLSQASKENSDEADRSEKAVLTDAQIQDLQRRLDQESPEFFKYKADDVTASSLETFLQDYMGMVLPADESSDEKVEDENMSSKKEKSASPWLERCEEESSPRQTDKDLDFQASTPYSNSQNWNMAQTPESLQNLASWSQRSENLQNSSDLSSTHWLTKGRSESADSFSEAEVNTAALDNKLDYLIRKLKMLENENTVLQHQLITLNDGQSRLGVEVAMLKSENAQLAQNITSHYMAVRTDVQNLQAARVYLESQMGAILSEQMQMQNHNLTFQEAILRLQQKTTALEEAVSKEKKEEDLPEEPPRTVASPLNNTVSEVPQPLKPLTSIVPSIGPRYKLSTVPNSSQPPYSAVSRSPGPLVPAKHNTPAPVQRPHLRSFVTAPPVIIPTRQEPLTATMLAAAPPLEQKQMLGERLFPRIQRRYPGLAGKITGMILEMDNSELLAMLEDQQRLDAKVEEAVAVLQAHQEKVLQEEAEKPASPHSSKAAPSSEKK